MGTITELDERDSAILAERLRLLGERTGPRVGDYVRFADRVERRVSHLWPDTAQTSDGGSYYLGDGYVSMSGSLYPGVRLDTLTATGESREGWVWFFHHGQARAHNGVDVLAPGFRVYESTEAAQR